MASLSPLGSSQHHHPKPECTGSAGLLCWLSWGWTKLNHNSGWLPQTLGVPRITDWLLAHTCPSSSETKVMVCVLINTLVIIGTLFTHCLDSVWTTLPNSLISQWNCDRGSVLNLLSCAPPHYPTYFIISRKLVIHSMLNTLPTSFFPWTCLAVNLLLINIQHKSHEKHWIHCKTQERQAYFT